MKAGFAKQDITPRVGVELYGFGPYLNRCSIGVRDNLQARAVAFDSGSKKALIVSCDLCALGPDAVGEIRKIIVARHAELAASDIMVVCSHTHSGPSTAAVNYGWGAPDPVYNEILPYKIAQAGLDALQSMEPVVVSAALVPCEGIGLNRVYDKDAPPLDEVLKEDWRPAKPELTDTKCRVIKFEDGAGKLKGFMAYFGCHPVVCCQQTRYIHGDYPAIAIHNLMRQFPGSIGLFLQGACGDVNSCVVHKPERESLLALDIVAGRFERAIREGFREAKPIVTDSLKTISETFEFTTRPAFTMEHLEELKKKEEDVLHRPDADENRPEIRQARVNLGGIRKMIAFLNSGAKPVVSAEVQGIQLGPLEFLGAPFEIMQAIKNDVLAAAGAPFTMVLSHCNGSCGYAPDKKSLATDSYESYRVPLIAGRLPYADIHRELVSAMLKLDAHLAR